eukprot:7378762-Prymnesium_polylepis.1
MAPTGCVLMVASVSVMGGSRALSMTSMRRLIFALMSFSSFLMTQMCSASTEDVEEEAVCDADEPAGEDMVLDTAKD